MCKFIKLLWEIMNYFQHFRFGLVIPLLKFQKSCKTNFFYFNRHIFSLQSIRGNIWQN